MQGGRATGGGRYGRGAGPGGQCLCPACGHREPHRRGVPCLEMRCPRCGAMMVRD